MNPRLFRLLVAVFACVLYVPLASANVYDFTKCPSSNPGCVANASLGTSQVTYTNGGISITANGYITLPTPTDLYFKVGGSASEIGLGLAVTTDFEIGPGNFIQLDLTNLATAGITSGTLVIGSVQTGEGFRICNSASLGVMGVCGANVLGGDIDTVTVHWTKASPIVGVTAAAGLTSPDNVLLVMQFMTASPPPFTGCTVTQGGWGAPPHGNNPGMFLKSQFSTVFPAGVTIGGTNTLQFTSASAIEAFLPQGGPPSFLNVSLVNPTSGTSAGVFAGQVLALELNVDLNGFGSLVLQGTGTSLDGKTVAEILAIANTALGGGALPAGFTFSSLNDLVDKLNESFDNCAPDGFAASHLVSP